MVLPENLLQLTTDIGREEGVYGILQTCQRCNQRDSDQSSKQCVLDDGDAFLGFDIEVLIQFGHYGGGEQSDGDKHV
jgi:hypothetical protein